MSKLETEFALLPAMPSDSGSRADSAAMEAAMRARMDLAVKALCVIGDQLGELTMQARIIRDKS